MNYLKILFMFLLLAGLSACGPEATFTEPQPADTDNLSKFPKRLQGQYTSLEDNSTLVISDDIIRRIYDLDFRFHPNKLDSGLKLSGDTLINLMNNEWALTKRDGDSLVAQVDYVDTLFHLGGDNVVRKFKGYYFLNTRYNPESWEVKKIDLSKGKLKISSIASGTDIDQLKEITEAPQDTIAVKKFTVTQKQFKEFIRQNGFSDSETFVRQEKKTL